MKVHLSVPYNPTGISVSDISICLFDWILYIPSTIFHLCMDGPTCVEPVLINIVEIPINWLINMVVRIPNLLSVKL